MKDTPMPWDVDEDYKELTPVELLDVFPAEELGFKEKAKLHELCIVDLKKELEAAGHKFFSSSDSEVLLTAYIAWGPDMLPRLNGIFAFAIYDTVERVLFLARDHFGIKPLYYAQTNHGLVFSSELKGMLASKMVQQGFGIAGNDIGIGADILARAALSDEFDDASGLYYDNDAGRFGPPHPHALDAQKTADVVRAIEGMIGG